MEAIKSPISAMVSSHSIVFILYHQRTEITNPNPFSTRSSTIRSRFLLHYTSCPPRCQPPQTQLICRAALLCSAMPVNEKSRCSAGGTWTSGGAAGEGRLIVAPVSRPEAVRAEGADVARMGFSLLYRTSCKKSSGKILKNGARKGRESFPSFLKNSLLSGPRGSRRGPGLRGAASRGSR